jgi:hypothetical protein
MPRRHAWYLCLSTVLAIFTATSHAAAQGDDNLIDDTRLYGGLWLGFGGDAELDGDDEFGGSLETTVGGQFGLEQVIARYLSIGAEVRIGAVKWNSTGDRSKVIDLDFKPRLRFPLRNTPLELYVTVPVGLTVPRLGDVDTGNTDGKIGWNVGAGAGLHVLLTDSFGINVEPIWLLHRFKVEGGGEKNDLSVKQFSLLINAVLAF